MIGAIEQYLELEECKFLVSNKWVDGNHITTIAFGFLGMFLFASLVRVDVVTQYSLENNLTDTAPSGVLVEDLSATPLTGPLNTVYLPGIVGQAVQIGSGG